MKKSSVNDLFAKIAADEVKSRQQQFIAPYLSCSKIAIVKINNINYQFNITGFDRSKSGLGVFQPIDHSCAKYVKEVDLFEKRLYLDSLPHVHLILCYATDKGWITIPMNMSVAKEKYNLSSEVFVYGVTDAQQFDSIIARYDGLHFWFDDVFSNASLRSEQIRLSFRPDLSVTETKRKTSLIDGVTPEEQKSVDLSIAAWIKFKKVSTEEMIKKCIETGGGKLGNFIVRGDNIEIKWSSRSGRLYSSLVNKKLDVVSAGICLDAHDGTGPKDKLFHLSDLPFVIAEGEKDHKIVVRR